MCDQVIYFTGGNPPLFPSPLLFPHLVLDSPCLRLESTGCMRGPSFLSLSLPPSSGDKAAVVKLRSDSHQHPAPVIMDIHSKRKILNSSNFSTYHLTLTAGIKNLSKINSTILYSQVYKSSSKTSFFFIFHILTKKMDILIIILIFMDFR